MGEATEKRGKQPRANWGDSWGANPEKKNPAKLSPDGACGVARD